MLNYFCGGRLLNGTFNFCSSDEFKKNGLVRRLVEIRRMSGGFVQATSSLESSLSI